MQIIENTPSEKVISISGLYKSFGNHRVIAGLDLELLRGENLIVLGRSGTGKSVLIKIICGMLTPDSGTVNVLGRDIANLDKKQLHEFRLKIGFSFQNSALYDSMTVRENLRFPLIHNFKNLTKKEIDNDVDMVLDIMGLPDSGDQMPSELSGGQKKRIGLARTLILRPEIVLYDEPTAGLDPISSVENNNLVNMIKTNYNVSSILITHDLACAKATGDRLAMMIDGKIERQGTFKEVFDSEDERITAFYNYNFTEKE